MAMGKLHKDIGHVIVQSAEDSEGSDSQVIKVTPPDQQLLLRISHFQMTFHFFTGHFYKDKRSSCHPGSTSQ